MDRRKCHTLLRYIQTFYPYHALLSNNVRKQSLFFQIFGAFVICLANLNMGALIAYPAIALPQWKNGTSHEVLYKKNHIITLFKLFHNALISVELMALSMNSET